MRRILSIFVFLLILSGCSLYSQQNKKTTESLPIDNQEQTNKNQELRNDPPAISQQGSQAQKTTAAQQETVSQQSIPTQSSTEQKEWFYGVIGNAKIHAKFDISGKNVSGTYYYDQYKSNINLNGSVDSFIDSLKDFQTIKVTEDTENKGIIMGVFKTKDYIQGLWKSKTDIYPMYLIREGSNIAPPRQPGNEAMKFDGWWTGKRSEYFSGTKANITALFDDLLYYDLSAFNGANSGILDSFGFLNNNVAASIFKGKTRDKNENVFFEFKVENDSLSLNSNGYDYYCGMGVAFDSSYTKGDIKFDIPTALKLRIVDTQEQDELFRKIVGDKYNEFIEHTQFADYREVTLDGKKVKAGASYFRGLAGYCYYIISPEYIYAANCVNSGIDYYTNDKNYASKLPQPIAEWAANEVRKNKKVNYNYVK